MGIRRLNTFQVIAEAPKLPGALQGASSTAEFYFDNSDGVDAKVSVPLTLVRKRPFLVRAGGRIQGAAGTTPDFQANLDAGLDSAFANNTTIFTTGSIALDNDTSVMTWYIEAILMLGEGNSKLQGTGEGWVNNTATARAVITESVEDLIADGVLHFKVSGTMSESIAAHGAYCDFLEVIADARPTS